MELEPGGWLVGSKHLKTKWQMIIPTVYMNRLVDIPNQILRARKESIVQLARLESCGILLVEEEKVCNLSI
jgi:hypothetical protein